MRIVYGLFFEGEPYALPHFLAGLTVTFVFIIAGGLLLATWRMAVLPPAPRRKVAITTWLHNNGMQLTKSARCAPFAFRSGAIVEGGLCS